MYRPKNKYEEELFPNLGEAKVVGGPSHVGEVGIIIHRDSECARIVFDNFWDRPDGMSADEADDSTWCFEGEYECLNSS